MPRPVPTIEELWALPEDGQRHELLDGVHVVTPSPTYPHQRLIRRLQAALEHSLEGHPELEVIQSPADVVLGPRTLVQPDLFVLRVNPAAPPTDWRDAGIPILAVEVLSPSTAARDRSTKRKLYQRAGIAEYWIVDPDARLIERWTPADARPEVIDDILRWAPDGLPLPEIPLSTLFGQPAGGADTA